MKSFTKNQKVTLLIILSVFIIGGIFYFAYLPKKKISAPPPENKESLNQEKPQEVYNLSATISEVNIGGKYLIVKSIKDGKEIKVVLSDDTEIIKLGLPFDPANPPKEGSFTLEETPIKIEDLKVGSRIFIQTTTDITGKNEFGDVKQIQVTP